MGNKAPRLKIIGDGETVSSSREEAHLQARAKDIYKREIKRDRCQLRLAIGVSGLNEKEKRKKRRTLKARENNTFCKVRGLGI
jgi:hypothetical protein